MTNRNLQSQYDYIVVGGGSSGCVLASRLSENSGVSVLLLESGPPDSSPFIGMPKGFAKILATEKYMNYFTAVPGENGKQDEETWIRGRTLGGSSSVNGMQYQRGHREDYDYWEQALGLKGWGWQEMEKQFLALEDHALGKAPWRGEGGPVPISRTTNQSFLMDKLIESAGELGLPELVDPSHPDQLGFSYICAIIKNGQRWSAAKAFLEPARSRSNLTVLTNSQVNRVIFDGVRAVGVEIDTKGGPTLVRCNEEVVLTAGTLETPKILQLSGVGDKAHLAGLGIPVVLHSPRVGDNLREHLIYTSQFHLTENHSQNKEYSGWRIVAHAIRYMLFRSGLLSTPPYDVTGFVRAHPDSPKADCKIVAAPITMDMAKWEGFHKQIPMERAPGMSIIGYVMKPESTGTVKITSNDPGAHPEIVHNGLSHSYDRKIALSLARFIRQLVTQSAIAPYIKNETLPGTQYQIDEELLEAYAMMSGPGFHAAGTCAMGSDESSVVDQCLRVRGLTGLRVADLSVFPTLVSGNTHGPVMAVANKAAAIILADRASK